MELDAGRKKLELSIDFERGSVFACPECGAAGCKAYDTEQRRWRHLNFFEHETHLSARMPRVRCGKFGMRPVAAPWARPGSGFTLLFEALILTLAAHMPVRAAAQLVGEHDTRIWRVLHHYVDRAKRAREDREVTQVGIDETASRRRYQYVSLFVDLEKRGCCMWRKGTRARRCRIFAKICRRTAFGRGLHVELTPVPDELAQFTGHERNSFRLDYMHARRRSRARDRDLLRSVAGVHQWSGGSLPRDGDHF